MMNVFCGEPEKYIWTEEMKDELDRVLLNIFKEQTLVTVIVARDTVKDSLPCNCVRD